MNVLRIFKKPSTILFIIVLLISIVCTALAYRLVATQSTQTTLVRNQNGTPTAKLSPIPTPKAGPVPTLAPVQNPAKILGVEGHPDTSYPGVPWIRIPYPTCGSGNFHYDKLKEATRFYHSQGIRVLLTLCEDKAHLYDTAPLFDAAHGDPDAVQCGNEQMKRDSSVSFLYVPPEDFARFYDLCEYEIHAVRADIPVLLGSLDPHVGGVDRQPLLDQVSYLNRMQQAMNTIVHPGGHSGGHSGGDWDWHTKTLGLIDSWHNGYPDSNVNSLSHLFEFWADQFHVNLEKGELGKHLWVVEGTGCFKGCGINVNDAAQVAISHILSLITDVQTANRYGIPFFYFSGKDFLLDNVYWPIGILDKDGGQKAIRQDLPMGSRKLLMGCSNGTVTVINQEQLLATLYRGCTLPSDYVNSITS